MESANPGTDLSNSVSWMASQSSSPISTALPRWPVMVSGSDSSLTWSINRYRFARADVALTAVRGFGGGPARRGDCELPDEWIVWDAYV